MITVAGTSLETFLTEVQPPSVFADIYDQKMRNYHDEVFLPGLGDVITATVGNLYIQDLEKSVHFRRYESTNVNL